jgi:hypothetical protein
MPQFSKITKSDVVARVARGSRLKYGGHFALRRHTPTTGRSRFTLPVIWRIRSKALGSPFFIYLMAFPNIIAEKEQYAKKNS